LIPVELAPEVSASLRVVKDRATPYSTYVRGVIVDGDRCVLLTGRDDSALIIEG
jgi:hypothetical protein